MALQLAGLSFVSFEALGRNEPAKKKAPVRLVSTYGILTALLRTSQTAALTFTVASLACALKGVAAVEDKPSGMALDVDYLQELIAIQEDCPKDIGFFGTRNMGFMHQQLIEILAYALCLTGNHIYTSGATGTNAAVIRGALRAERPELLTVVLPQSLAKQPRESRELLEGVAQIVEAPENEDMPLVEASRICNDTIVSKVKQIIVFAFHDSRLLLETCRNAKTMRKLVTLFYLD